MTNQQKTKALKAHLKEVAGFIPSQQWLKDNLHNYEFIDGKVYHVLALPQVESESQSHNHDIAEPIETKEVEVNSEHLECDSEQNDHSSEQNDHSSEQNDHSSEHINKIDEAVILHHEGVKAFINKYNDVQVLRAFHFQGSDRFLIFCKDLKVKKTKKEEYCLFWWDWENRITTKSGDYIDCFLQYELLVDLMGNPKPITLPESPDLTEYYRKVTYCPAGGDRCEQFTLALGV